MSKNEMSPRKFGLVTQSKWLPIPVYQSHRQECERLQVPVG
jgi:hypothetical protein